MAKKRKEMGLIEAIKSWFSNFGSDLSSAYDKPKPKPKPKKVQAVEFLESKSVGELFPLARERAAFLKFSASDLPARICQEAIEKLGGYESSAQVPESRYHELAKIIGDWEPADESGGAF